MSAANTRNRCTTPNFQYFQSKTIKKRPPLKRFKGGLVLRFTAELLFCSAENSFILLNPQINFSGKC